MNDLVLQTKALSVAYADLTILDKVDFQSHEGEFVALVGRSGIGKSSFLNALAGLIPSTGEIVVDGSIGYVFQTNALFPWLTVEKNIGFGISHWASQDYQSRVQEMLKEIDMVSKAKHYPSMLSGGQVQRVALARALAPNPEILLMDEPYGALDHHTRERMQLWLLSIWEQTQKTVLFVTHYIEEAVFLADRVIVIKEGKFCADLKVSLARPRTDAMRFLPEFLEMKHQIIEWLGN